MKKLSILLILAIMLAFVVLPASAWDDLLPDEEGGYDNYDGGYIYDEESGTLTITSDDAMVYFPTEEPFYYGEGAPWCETEPVWWDDLEYYTQNSFDAVVIAEGVTYISAGAFYGCEIGTLTLPSTLEYISSDAFMYATVNDIYYNGTVSDWLGVQFAERIPGNHTLYLNGQEADDIVIPDGTTRIEQYAFAGCHSLTSAAIPDSVIYIYSSAFDFSIDYSEAGSGYDPQAHYDTLVCPYCGSMGCSGGYDCPAMWSCDYCGDPYCPSRYGDECPMMGGCPFCGDPYCPGAYGEECSWGSSTMPDEPWEEWSFFSLGDAAEFYILCNEDSYAASFAKTNNIKAHYYQHTLKKVRNGNIITAICQDCGYTYDYEVAADYHEYKELSGKAPTCTKTGYEKRYVCTICSDVKIVGEIPALGHSFVSYDRCEPTCTSYGNYAYDYCTRCNYSTYRSIPALGHSYKKIETKDSTCSEKGYSKYSCQREGCGQQKTEIIRMKNHSYGRDNICDYCGFVAEIHTHNYSITEVYAPSCNSHGYTLHKCECGASYTSDYKASLSHQLGSGVVTSVKTCTQNGLISYTCQLCGIKSYDAEPAGHNWVEPVCTMAEPLYRYCADCGLIDDEAYTVQHNWKDAAVEVAATCTKEGYVNGNCTACGLSGSQVVEALGHDFVNGRCTTCKEYFYNTIEASSDNVHGMAFEFDETVSKYGKKTVNKYGVFLDFNEDAYVSKVGIYLTQEGSEWKRCIAFTGTGITYANYVPYLANGSEIVYSGLDSELLNKYPLVKNSNGVWNYADFAPIEVNLEDMYGEQLMAVRSIGSAGAKTRIFSDLDQMIAWLNEDACKHNWNDPVVETSPTCTTIGFALYTCASCDMAEKEAILPAHEYIEHEGKAPTCTESGYAPYTTCNHCDETTYKEIAALGHAYATFAAKEPTCTAAGNKEYSYCSRCDYTEFTADKEIAPLGHDCIEHKDKAPTCTDDGYEDYVECQRCNYYSFKTIGALGHDFTNSEHKSPTCTEAGYDNYFDCSRCGEDKYVVLNPLGHSCIWFEGSAPTCIYYGFEAYEVCTRCSYSTYASIAPLGHEFESHDFKAPTCTEAGYDNYFDCSRCGEDSCTDIPAQGHTIKTTIVEPTYTTEGKKTNECTKCDFEEIETIPMLEVSSGDVSLDGEVDVKDALLVLNALVNGTDIDSADMNGDGEITLIDVIRILKLIIK